MQKNNSFYFIMISLMQVFCEKDSSSSFSTDDVDYNKQIQDLQKKLEERNVELAQANKKILELEVENKELKKKFEQASKINETNKTDKKIENIKNDVNLEQENTTKKADPTKNLDKNYDDNTRNTGKLEDIVKKDYEDLMKMYETQSNCPYDKKFGKKSIDDLFDDNYIKKIRKEQAKTNRRLKKMALKNKNLQQNANRNERNGNNRYFQ